MVKTAQGRVVALSISARRGIPKGNVSVVELVADWGIEGDAHAGKWHRQVSLLPIESIAKMHLKGIHVRPGGFAENITTEFVELPQLHIGDTLRIGEAELELTQIGKECHNKCAIYFRAGDCVMPRDGVFAIVKRGGRVQIGDGIIVKSPERSETALSEVSG